jgi:IclR family mhp operon transcriptional activator
MSSQDPIRAIGRGLDVIEALNESPVTSLAALHERTGLPKPSLVRLLETLIERGYVVRVSRTEGYALTEAVLRLACGIRERDRLVDLARPLMEAFTRRHKWQVSLSTSETDAMRVRFSTRHISPFARDQSYVNRRIPMLRSAMGRAYFAHCGRHERDVILQTRRDASDVLPIERDPAALATLVRCTRAHGFAVPEAPISDRVRSFAVPILQADEPDSAIGAISLFYYASVMRLDEALAAYLPPLQQLAAEIAAGLLEGRGRAAANPIAAVPPPEIVRHFRPRRAAGA